jgi:DNA polymerase-3 subunit alpha (Gram-positive type)
MNIKNTEFVVFDVETTGLSAPDGDRIIEIAAMKIRDGKVIDKFYSLINPQRLIPSEASRVHNITDDMVTEAPTSLEVLPQMLSFISSSCVAGHNVKFDLGFLAYELALMGRKINESTPAIDTLKMARDLLPYLSNHKLAYLARSLGVVVSETHRAMADVDLTVQVLIRLMEMASDQNLDEISKFFAKFSVEKPAFKLVSTSQASLF